MSTIENVAPINGSRFEVAYNILIQIFKKNISLKIAKNSLKVGYKSLSASEKAKCNDLVLKTLKHVSSIDIWIKKNKKSRVRLELLCILRLIVTEVFVRNGRKAEILKSFSVLASRDKKTFSSKGYIKHFIHLSFKHLLEKNFTPYSQFELNFREKLLDQYSEKELKKMEFIFSLNSPLDIVLKNEKETTSFFNESSFIELYPGCIRLKKNDSITKMKGYSEGHWWIQNFSASLPVSLINKNLINKNVLDVCCAPGGKTFQLLSRGAKVTAIDKSPSRISVMKENISRLGFKVDLVCEDVFKFTPKKKYDYILLDPPCTSTGTLSKNPDLMFLDPHKRLKNLLKLQENLLQSSTKWISKGGLIIYSVCSLLKEEGEDQILRFLKTNKTFKQINPDVKGLNLNQSNIDKNGGIRVLPYTLSDKGWVDGFYIAYIKSQEEK